MQAETKLQEYGPIKVHTLRNGTLIQLLPTCSFPLNYLLEGNWTESCRNDSDCGNFRRVREISRLKDGTRFSIYAKSAERTFTADPRVLARGEFWWGGRQSREKKIYLCHQTLVEERTVWETVYLLEMNRLGILAEKPQALIIKPSGEKELLVAGIESSFFGNCFSEGDEAVLALREAGFVMDDFQFLTSEDGVRHIIDVNRWEWFPFTNDSHAQLLDLVRLSSGV